ncbi:unnamed protein product [Pylaiella littoralis]
MQAVQDTLQYKVLATRQLFSSAFSLPEKVVRRITGAADTWKDNRPAQARQRLMYQQSKQALQAGRKIFSSARVQESVREEWIQGGHRVRAVRMLLLYLVYLAIFTLSAILNSGRNMPHGYHLTMSVRSSIESGSALWDKDEGSFGTVESAEKIWEWLQSPVVDFMYKNTNMSWHDGINVTHAGQWQSVHMMGKPRLSQWRTASNSCAVSFFWLLLLCLLAAVARDYCFTDYCGEEPGVAPLCYGASMDDRSFGPNFMYRYESDVHTTTMKGTFGVYGPGAFVQYLETNDRNATLTAMETLEANGWIDESTRAVSLELAIHSSSGRKVTYVMILIELPAEGGAPLTRPSYNTFSTFDSADVLRRMLATPGEAREHFQELAYDGGGILGDRLVFLMEVALIVMVLVNVMKERMELRRQGPYYYLNFANVFDIVLIAGHGVIFYLQGAKTAATRDLDFEDYEQHIDLRQVQAGLLRLADLVMAERQWVATMVIMVWIKLMDPLQAVFEDFFLLVKMIALMIGELVKSFLPLLGIIYVSWAFARYVVLGELESLMSSISSAVANQYPEALGEFTFERIREENLYQSWRYSFTAMFTVLVVVVMLNLLVSLLNDLYEELKSLAKADWCRAQATSMYMNARWHQQQRIFHHQKESHKSKKSGGINSNSNDGTHHQSRWWCSRLSRLLGWFVPRGNSGDGETDVDSMKRTPPPVDDTWSSKVGLCNKRPMLRLKEKAFAMGRDHLQLESMAEEVQAAAMLDYIIGALGRWDRQSRHAAIKGELSPLPPVEALQKLRCLVTDNNSNDDENGSSKISQARWILLRQKVLMPLAGIIGADGRGRHAEMGAGATLSSQRRHSIERVSHEPLRQSYGVVMKMLERAIEGVQRWVSDLKDSFTPSEIQRLHSWNEARKESIMIARSLVEFALSQASAQEGTAAAVGYHRQQIPAQLKTANTRGVDPQRATTETHHWTSADEAARGDPTKFSIGGTAIGKDNKSSSKNKSGRSEDGVNTWSNNSGGTRSSGAPGERYDGGSSWVSGNEILTTLEGGYLVVTALSTLSRVVASSGMMKQAADASKLAPSSDNICSNDNNDHESVFGHLRPTQEVIALSSLLASLFRLGSPTSQQAPLPSLAAAAATAAAAAEVDGVSITGLPPTQAEVEHALGAGQSTALRRRRSSTALPHLPLLPRARASFGSADREKPGGGGQGPGNGQAAADHRLPATTQTKHDPYVKEKQHHNDNDNNNINERGSLRRERELCPSPAPPQALARESSGGLPTATNTPPPMMAAPILEATPPSSPGRPRLVSPPQENDSAMTAGLELTRRKFSTFHLHSIPDKAPLGLRYYTTDAGGPCGGRSGFVTPPPRTSSAYRSLGGGLGLAMGATCSKSGGQSAAAGVEPRISAADFEKFGEGNFAVYLSAQWRNQNSNSGGEIGFDMLARLALKEGRPLLLRPSSSSSGGSRAGTGRELSHAGSGTISSSYSNSARGWWLTGE